MREDFIRLIQEIAAEEKLSFESFSGDWAIRLSRGTLQAFIVGYHFPLNPSSVKELCQDKCLTYEVLKDARVPAVPHLFLPADMPATLSSNALVRKQMNEWIASTGYAVIKNNYGTGGHQVFRAASSEEAEDQIKEVLTRSYASSVSPFLNILEEYRVVMLDGRPMLTIRKERESVVENGQKRYLTWKHNLGQGATGIVVTDRKVKSRLHRLAKKAMKALGARFASVDVVETASGLMILEVNSGVMLAHFSGQDETCYKLAKHVYRQAIRTIMEVRND